MSEKLRILIVEDNPADADFIHELLPQAGPLYFHVESAQRLSEAVARLERGNIDLVLLDLGLPDSQGLETLHALQKVAVDIPVVVMTGNDDQELAMAAVRDGAQDYLVKGQMSGRPLIRTVRYALARQKAAEALRQSEHKYRTLVEAIPQRIFVKGPDYRYLSANENYARDLGIKPEEIVGKTDFDFHPRELAEKYRADDRRIMRMGKTESFEEKAVVQGRECWVHCVKTPMKNEAGEITGVLGIFWDITERKRADAELQKFNRALRLVSQCNLEMVHTTDETALMQAVCRLAVEQGGYRMAWVGFAENDEAKSVRVTARAGFVDGYLDTANITWADVERGRGPTGTSIRTGKPVYTRNMITDPAFVPWREAATRRGYASSIALPMMNEGRCFGALTIYSGEPDVFDTMEIGLLAGLANDLAYGIAALRHRAERGRAEETLQASESRFRTLIEKSPVAISISRAGRTIYVNQKFLELYGYQSAQELAGHLIADDWAPECREMITERTRRRARGETVPSEYEGIAQRKDGSQFPVEIKVSQVELPDGPASMAFLTDITERRRDAQRIADALSFNQAMLGASPVGIIVFKATGECVSASEALVKIAGGPREALLKQNFHQLESWKNSGMLAAAEDALATQTERFLETQSTTTFGRKGWFSCRFTTFQYRGEPHLLLLVNDITERKRAEQALLASEATLHAVFQAAPIGICIMKDRLFQSANAFWCESFGYPEKSLLGKSPRMLYESDEEYDRVGRELYAHLQERGIATAGTRLRRSDGVLRDVILTTAPLRDGDPTAGIVTTIRDITERKRAEKEIERTALEWQTTFDAMEEAVWILDRDNRILRTNKAAEKFFNHPCCDMMAKPCWEIAHCATGPIPNCPFVLARKSGHREMVELQQDGRWLAFAVDPITDAGGHIAGAVHIVSDITERKRAEQQMKEAFDFNQTIIADAAVGIVAYKASGQCVLANEAAAKTLNGPVPRLLEQNFRHLVSWHASGLLQIAEEVLATKEPRQCEAHLTTSFGREVWLASHFSHFIQNGEPHLLHIFIDATDQKKLESQFLRSQRMESLGTLAGGIAHDLNNVLAPILISIQLLKEEIADPALKKLLDSLETNVSRGADLVQQVMVFGRSVKTDREIIHVQHIAHEIRDIVRETFPKSVEFQMEVARDLWPVSCDPTQIHQVLLNLAINARDAMPGGGRLSLRLENVTFDKAYAGRNPEAQPGPYVLISVQDTGAGIPAEVQEHMFEPFFTTKEAGKGTGLGLSTTLGIVKSHGGFILCESAPGKGSVFKVHLPASAAPGSVTSSKTTQMPRGHNELILVVDDEPSILEIALATLTHFGYRALPAANGAEAVEIYRKRHDEIAAVITDMAMPVMDGAATIIALKAINPDVKIIASSGFSSKMTMPGKSRVPFKHFIHKPYSSAKLLQEIHAILHEDSTEESAPKKDKARPGGK
jgi:PAS domain S-box-containing protein